MAKVYRGIVVVHGVGEHKKGSYISGFVEELVSFLSHEKALGAKNVQLSARDRSDRSDTTWATLHLRNGRPEASTPEPTREQCEPEEWDEEWHIREAWWTKTFEPTKPLKVYLWGVLAGLALLRAIYRHQLQRAWLTTFKKGSLAARPSERLGRPINPATHEVEAGAAQGVWEQPRAGALKAIGDTIVWFFMTLLLVVVGIAGLAIVGVAYMALVLPVSLVAPVFATKLLNAVSKVIVLSLGDQQAMTTRPMALRAAANEVQTALWSMLSGKGLLARNRDDSGFKGFETVTVVAHSGGCLVSLAALTSVDFGRFRADKLPAGYVRPERVNLVTAGSGLNLGWNVRYSKNDADEALWGEPPCGVNWLNIYARYDPVPQGPPPSAMVFEVTGGDPEVPEFRGAATHRPAYVNLRVVNSDNPWADHSGYWRNHAEVMSRVVHLITRKASATARLGPDDTVVEPKNLARLKARIDSQVAVEAPKCERRTTRTMLVLLGVLALFVAACGWAAVDVGEWALGKDGFWGMNPWRPGDKSIEGGIVKRLEVINLGAYAAVVTGVAVIAFAGLLAFEYANGLTRGLLTYASTGHPSWTLRTHVFWWIGSILVLLLTAAALDLLLIRWPTGQLG